MNSVEFINRGKFDCIEDGVDKELKVTNGDAAFVEVVGCSNGEEVRNAWTYQSREN